MDENLNAFEACSARHSATECALYFEALGLPEERVFFHADQVRCRQLVCTDCTMHVPSLSTAGRMLPAANHTALACCQVECRVADQSLQTLQI